MPAPRLTGGSAHRRLPRARRESPPGRGSVSPAAALAARRAAARSRRCPRMNPAGLPAPAECAQGESRGSAGAAACDNPFGGGDGGDGAGGGSGGGRAPRQPGRKGKCGTGKVRRGHGHKKAGEGGGGRGRRCPPGQLVPEGAAAAARGAGRGRRPGEAGRGAGRGGEMLSAPGRGGGGRFPQAGVLIGAKGKHPPGPALLKKKINKTTASSAPRCKDPAPLGRKVYRCPTALSPRCWPRAVTGHRGSCWQLPAMSRKPRAG